MTGADEQARAQIAALEKELGVSGAANVFRAALSLAKQAREAAALRPPSSQPAGSEAMAVEVLRGLEWSQSLPEGLGWKPWHRACPVCRGIRDHGGVQYGNHKPDCRLAAALSATAPPDGGEPTPGTAQGVVEVPLGAIENAYAFALRVESNDFQCAAGSLQMCVDWIELMRCIDALRTWPWPAARLRTASPAGTATDPQGEADVRQKALEGVFGFDVDNVLSGDVEADALQKLLRAGKGSSEDQSNAADWIVKLHIAIRRLIETPASTEAD